MYVMLVLTYGCLGGVVQVLEIVLAMVDGWWCVMVP